MITLTLLEKITKTPLQQWHFEDSTVVRIGRAVDNHIVLSDSSVSRYHLELRLITNPKGDNWEIISQGTNGTFLNGSLITRSILTDNSLLQLAIGGPLIQVQIQKLSPVIAPPLSSLVGEINQVIKPLSSASRCTHEGNDPGNVFCVHCGQPILIQKTIRHYQIIRTLGKGGMGTTYLAADATGETTNVTQLLVLKEMNADMAKIPKARELFEREASILKYLNHEGVPKYYDFFVEDGKKYLAMELIHGQDLEKRISLTGPVTPPQAIAWMVQTCDILDYLHGQEPPLIHRDIKPANLMVRGSNNSIVVLDFGAVKEIGTKPGTRIGAVGYCAPEQERGQPLTQSDLYAIGPTLIFLLTGENPVKFYRQQGRNFRFDVRGIPAISSQLRQVIECVTEPLPARRYHTAQELAQALKSVSK
ncbi:FHA domain-containing serine/threonine-protein kinase [Dolichospermum circinale]|uniref:FHA domain-containing serine/threonine-protein kinase n=1 Tax=Dolichospermum circinale TaxID=109265 RepID=UPI000486A3AD|nr:FHA domain-containing serine/threonine-protein kinase [Dolichospermum circinale]MDB9454308.1 serine/threonine-protein kinase [Dolichospermum circinale CS-541/06]MDB9461257.1 serine/threonine-protein kinase [Dolichospermum circinale CS-541/04]MDB9474146.1 serine/threonine-protein kinase [Dolichospermum circinale CS-537/11]MDB9479060.1 serine/threonine-protein kinase [Dolichospermum circinale CS-537/03]